jgi:hypothetical protein
MLSARLRTVGEAIAEHSVEKHLSPSGKDQTLPCGILRNRFTQGGKFIFSC